MHEQGKTDIKKRIREWKAKCIANEMSYKEVIESADMNYNSVINALNNALKGNPVAISAKKLEKLEKAIYLLVIKRNI
ncbi:MAG: hypothetical protein ED557_02300 [Balneola sp.]|nr:MAG: hypothetical protein ED557_02300 [Balneola sp.]